MNRNRTLRARQKLIDHLPVTGELLRGTLLERIVPSSHRAAVEAFRAETRATPANERLGDAAEKKGEP